MFEGAGAIADERVVVEVFSMVNVRTPVEELVRAVANKPRWKDRLDVRVTHVAEWPTTETPYGTITDNTVVVAGTRIISGNDYWGLQEALEEAALG